MSQLYGLFAGLFVCLPTWAAVTYLSTQTGLLIGLFLVTFFVVTTIYVNGDEMAERHKTLAKSQTDMEIIFFDQLKLLEAKIDTIHEATPASQSRTSPLAESSGDLDKMLDMIERILHEHEQDSRDRASR